MRPSYTSRPDLYSAPAPARYMAIILQLQKIKATPINQKFSLKNPQTRKHMRKVIFIVFITALLSVLMAIANGCKTTKHIAKKETATDSIAAHVIDSTVTSEIEHTAKDLAEHSEIKENASEKTIVTTTEVFTPDPKTGAPQLQQRTTKTEKKKSNNKKIQVIKTDQSIVDRKKDSVTKKDSSAAIVHRSSAEIKKDVKRKTPLGVYITIGALVSAFAFFIYQKNRGRI